MKDFIGGNVFHKARDATQVNMQDILYWVNAFPSLTLHPRSSPMDEYRCVDSAYVAE